jgi:hypothetical protein
VVSEVELRQRQRLEQIYIKKQKFAHNKSLERILDINYVKMTNIYEMYSYRIGFYVVIKRAVGIEPTTTAWKAVVLPLNYARKLGKLFLPPKQFSIAQAICNWMGKPSSNSKFEIQGDCLCSYYADYP